MYCSVIRSSDDLLHIIFFETWQWSCHDSGKKFRIPHFAFLFFLSSTCRTIDGLFRVWHMYQLIPHSCSTLHSETVYLRNWQRYLKKFCSLRLWNIRTIIIIWRNRTKKWIIVMFRFTLSLYKNSISRGLLFTIPHPHSELLTMSSAFRFLNSSQLDSTQLGMVEFSS